MVGCRAEARVLLALLCVAVSFTAATAAKRATRADSAIPLPPPRPAELGGRPEDIVSRGVTDPRPSAPVRAVAVATVPRALPPASRERMHACGLEWQQIKWSGSAGERTWRDFATECLPR